MFNGFSLSRLYRFALLGVGLHCCTSAYALPPLQLYVELTPAGGVLKPEPGRYAGPVVIKRPITIDGAGEVEIDGGNKGTVISILADDVVLRGLHISNSGSSHDSVDAGILISADKALVENNQLDGVLFGIHLNKANDSVVRGNTISSLDRDISIRGDGIRLWYSHGNLIENNTLSEVRDMVANNSLDNRIIANTIQNSRIGMELVYSHGNEIAHNIVSNNVTGIVGIYSNDLAIHDNRISHMRVLTGAGLSLKESAEVLVDNNQIAHCAVGLQANSPLDPENKMIASNNLFAYNVLGLYFYGEKGGHIITNNRFERNFTDAMGSAAPAVRDNVWQHNYWDQYQGFDQDNDGIGDQPHEVYFYSEQIWSGDPMSRFFRGAPVMEMLDFAFRLAPLSMPVLQYSDPEPLMADRL